MTKSIEDILKKDPETLTEKEKKWLEQFKKTQFRHSTNFVYHSRKLPKEPNSGRGTS